jgi:hypothetical protein
VLYTGMALVIAGAAFHWRAGKGPRKAGGS